MATLILVRHGQSQWNLENRFTGWIDVPLTEAGRAEARRAGELIRTQGIRFDVAYTSVLTRAIETLQIILSVLGQGGIPIIQDQALNERHYGELQGMNKDEMRRRFGEPQVRLWRRSYDVAPPGGESLKDTAARTIPFFESRILADLKTGRQALVSAHGNSLRSIVMHLDRLTKEEVLALEIPTGVPIRYEIRPAGTVSSKEILTVGDDSALGG
jgi:2,3-bisphosphoglycerate-dependent phosphoglycerate mutase